MARLQFLHVSDLHLGAGSSTDIQIVIDALLESAARQRDALQRPIHAILFSGDLANSADKADFLEKGFEKFLLPLADAVDVPLERLCIAPGNHDISREIARGQAVMETGLKTLLSTHEAINHFFDSRADSSEFGASLKRSEMFAKIARHYLPSWQDTLICSTQNFEIDGCKVGVACLNTAWRATGESDDVDFGHLIIGERILDEAIAEIEHCDLKIAVHHHPLDWLQAADQQAVRPRLTRCFDLSCTGHLHDAFPSGTQSPHGSLISSQAPSIYQGRSKVNGYQIISVDTELWTYDFTLCKYVDNGRRFDANVDVAPSGQFSLSALDSKTRNCSQSELFLRHKRSDIQAIVESHLDMADLKGEGCQASDLFVPPVLSKRIHEPAGETSGKVDFADVDVSEIIDSCDNSIVVGPRQSGKTSLALHLVQRIASGATKEQRIPVYADFKHLKLNAYGLRGAIGSFYGGMPPGFDLKRALDDGAFTFVIDNFDGHSRDSLAKFAALVAKFPKMRWICLGTPDSGAVVKERVYRELLPDFSRLHMRELPRRQIRQLTRRWVEKGGLSGDPKELFSAVMDQLARGGLPRTPYMVTLLLWAIRRRQSNHRLNEAVLLGMVVDYLLGKADFRQSRLGALDPTAKEIILQEIAFWMQQNDGTMPENALMEQLAAFLTRKRSPFVAGDVLEKLIETGLLRRSEGQVAFKYECFREYFVALAMKADMAIFRQLMSDLHFLDFAREIELLAGLRRTNNDIIAAIHGQLSDRAPDDFKGTKASDFDAFARKEMRFSVDAEQLRQIKKTRLTEEQVDEMMDEADRRALERGEEKVTDTLNRTDGDLASAVRRRQKQAIQADQVEKPVKVRPGTFVAGLELLAKVLKYSEFSDFDVRGPVTSYVIDGWVRIFLRIVAELQGIVEAVDARTEKPASKTEQETIIYYLGSHLFNMMAGGLNDILASPSSAATALELLDDGHAGLGRRLFTLFLLEDANHPGWAAQWSQLLEDSKTRGFVMQSFIHRLWVIAHSKSLDVDQSAQVEAIVTSIEKRLDLTKNEKGRLLQDLRDATTIASYTDKKDAQ